jgi:sugar phosphate isomerase/epimerase
MAGRLLPGQGELPLVEMVGDLLRSQPDMHLGIEAPGSEMQALTPDVGAERAARSVRALLERLAISPSTSPGLRPDSPTEWGRDA